MAKRTSHAFRARHPATISPGTLSAASAVSRAKSSRFGSLTSCPHRAVPEPDLLVRVETDCMALTASRSKMLIGATITVKVSPMHMNGSTAFVSLVGLRPRRRAFLVKGEVMTG